MLKLHHYLFSRFPNILIWYNLSFFLFCHFLDKILFVNFFVFVLHWSVIGGTGFMHQKSCFVTREPFVGKRRNACLSEWHDFSNHKRSVGRIFIISMRITTKLPLVMVIAFLFIYLGHIFGTLVKTDATLVHEVKVKHRAPKLHFIYPNCFEAGRPMEFVACGSHLLQPNFR